MLPHTISTAAIAGSHIPSTFHPSPPPFGSDEATLPHTVKHQALRPQLPPSPPCEHLPSPVATPDPVNVVNSQPELSVASPPTVSSTEIRDEPMISPVSLTVSEVKGCQSVLASIQRHEKAWPFLVPVDPVAVGALDYFDIVKQPMDLSTISAKLSRGEYCLVQEFAADVMLMFDNCYLYNPATNDIHKLGRALESHFSLQFSKVFPALTACATRGGPEGKRKRKIKPPKVFEIDDAPSKRAKGAAGSRKGSVSSSRRLSTVLPAQLAHLSSSGVDEQIAALSSYLQSMTDQLVALSNQATATPAKRRPVKKGAKNELDNDDAVIISCEKTAGRTCGYCHSSETPLWRRGPAGGGTLCNKCGVQWKMGKLSGVPPPKGKSRKSAVKKVAPLSFSEKQDLVNMFENLTEEQTKEVLEIVGSNTAGSGDVVEIEMDALDDTTLRELYLYAKVKTAVKPALVSESGDVMPRSVTGNDDSESESDDDGESSGSESD